MKKIFKIIIAIILGSILMLIIFKNVFIKFLVISKVKEITGVKVEMKYIDAGIFKNSFEIRGLKLYNPKGFLDNLMADIPEVYVSYDLWSFFKRGIHLENVKINIKELIVVRNNKEELNLAAFKSNKAKAEESSNKEEKVVIYDKKSKNWGFRIDNLDLKVGDVIYKDYSRGGEVLVQKFTIDLDEQYENVDEPATLAINIVARILLNTTISELANLNISAYADGSLFKGKSKDTISKAIGIFKDILSSVDK